MQVEYLQKEDIVLINQLTIQKHGGNFVTPFNFLIEGSLDYLLEAVQTEMFDAPLYLEILIHFTLEMASGAITLEDSRLWFENNLA